jgi:hypothetical protein
MSGLLLGIVLSVCTCWFHNMGIIIIIIIIIYYSSGVTLVNLIYNYGLHQSNYKVYQQLLIDKFMDKMACSYYYGSLDVVREAFLQATRYCYYYPIILLLLLSIMTTATLNCVHMEFHPINARYFHL